MSEFATPQRVMYTSDGKENINSLHRFDYVTNKLDDTTNKPTRKIPMGPLFESNRGLLQSGAQRILVKEKESKSSKAPLVSKTNFMKPTEAYRNGHQNTPNSKFADKLSQTPTSVTHPHSGTKQRISSTPKPLLIQQQVVTTPARSETSAHRASSTPPSAKRVATPTPTSAASGRGGGARPSVRAHLLQQSPARPVASSTHTILYSPSSEGIDRHRRSTSAPRSRPSVESGQSVVHRLAFMMPGDDEIDFQPNNKVAKQHTSPNHDLSHRSAQESDRNPTSTASPPSSSSSDRAAKPVAVSSSVKSAPHQRPPVQTQSAPNQVNKLHLFKNPAPSSLLVTTADTLSANKAAKKAVIASLKTTAAAPSHHYSAATHSSTAAMVTPATVLSTPNRKPRVPSASSSHITGKVTTSHFAGNAAQVVASAEKRSPAIAAPSTPIRQLHAVQSTPDRSRPPSTPSSVSKALSSVGGSATKRVTKKVAHKRVTISAASPTILNANGDPRRRGDPRVEITAEGGVSSRGVAPAPMFDVGRVLDSISSSSAQTQTQSQSSHQTKSLLLSDSSGSQTGFDAPHNRVEANEYSPKVTELRRSMSFGSDISSVRGFGGFSDCTQADISIAETINLSANTSMFEAVFSAPAASSDSYVFDCVGESDIQRNRDALARLALEKGLMDVSAVCDDATRCDSAASSAFSPGIFSASSSFFAPIVPPAPPATNSRTPIDPRLVSQQHSRKASRHHHNTATVTSRSTDYANFYSQYSASGESSVLRGVSGSSTAFRGSSSTSMPTPIERTGSQHYLANLSMTSTPWSRQNSQQDDFRFSMDCGSVEGCDSVSEEGDSALDRGMLVSEESVFSDGVSCSTGARLELNTAMTMSSAFQFLPRASRPASTSSAAANFSLISQLSSSFGGGPSASTTPRIRTGGAGRGLESSRCSFMSTNSCPSELNRAMVVDEEDEESRCSSEDTGRVIGRPSASVDGEAPVRSDEDHCEQSSISCCETTLHGRDSTFDSASSLLMTGEQQRQLDILVGHAHFVGESVALSVTAAIRDLTNTTCIGMNAEDVHSLDSGYALLLDESRERDASSQLNAGSSDVAGSSGDEVNMEDSADAKTIDVTVEIEEEEEGNEAFDFTRRDSGEQNDTVLCEEVNQDQRSQTEEMHASFFRRNQPSRAFPGGADLSSILPSRGAGGAAAWDEDSHFVDEESCATLHCSATGGMSVSQKSSLPSVPPPQKAVSNSFELLPRSASALPVPITHIVSSTPVTKSYLDFERKDKLANIDNQPLHQRSLFRSLTASVDVESEQVLNDSSVPSDHSDMSSQPFVSSLPLMRRQEAQPWDSSSRVLSERSQNQQVSVIMSNSGFSASSVSSRSSCTDELQRLNPRSGVDQWAKEQYGHLHGGASCFLNRSDALLHIHSAEAQDSFSFDGMSLLSDREEDAYCPDPLFSVLHSKDAWSDKEHDTEEKDEE